MPFDPATLGMQAASSVQDTLMGLVLEGHNDQRQLQQEEKLLRQQAGIDREQTLFNKEVGLDTWKKTGPVGMVEQLKKAGLSPALYYGGSGGGGQTMGTTGSVNAGSAPRGGGEIIGLQMMNAQRELIQAQTENVKADTIKKAGVDTDLVAAQGRLAKNVAQMYVDTYEDNYQKLKAEAEILVNQSKVSAGTTDAAIKIKEAELVGLGIGNELKQAQKDLTEEQMKATVEMVKQKWQEVNIKQGHLDLDRFLKDVKESTKLTTEAILRVISIIK